MDTPIVEPLPSPDNIRRCAGPCGRDLPIECFRPHKAARGGRCPICRECEADWKDATRNLNDPRRERHIAASRAYIREKARQRSALRTDAHRDELTVYFHDRRARKMGSEGTFTPADLAAVRAAQTDKHGRLICAWCGKPITDTPHLDHWIPLTKGGTNDAGNLRYMHARCNISKNDTHPHELGRLI